MHAVKRMEIIGDSVMNAQTAYNKAYAEAVKEKARPSTIGGMSDLDIAIEEKMNDMGFRRVPEFERLPTQRLSWTKE